MEIREKNSQHVVEVYGLYWANYQGKNQRFHLIIPEQGYPGFLSVPEADCEIIDPMVSGFTITKNARGQDTLLHPVLLEAGLLDRLIDHDSDAMTYFLAQLQTT